MKIFGAAVTAALVVLAPGCGQSASVPSVPATPFDPATMQLFLPSTGPAPDLVCLPWMNRLHIQGCPMVLI